MRLITDLTWLTHSFLLLVAWVQALAGTLGSLYFSEIMGFPPCNLCWWQRVFMYPLAIILGVAWKTKDYLVFRYGLPLAGMGLVVALYHNYLTYFGPSQTSSNGICSLDNPCTTRFINWFGFVSIPLLSLAAYALICWCLVMIWKNSNKRTG